jgi:hypothetical protein
MPKYLVNPASKGRKKSGPKKRRTAAQKAATKKMLAAAKKARRGASRKSPKRAAKKRSPKMAAKKKGRKAATSRRKSTGKKRRSPVTSLRRHAVYQTNPRRRKNPHRRHYRRNPGMVQTAISIAKDSAAVLVGGAAGRTIGGFLPSFGNPVAEAAKGVLVAIGVRMIGSRFLGGDFGRLAAAGAMQVPLKNLITGFVPGVAGFLGDYSALGDYAMGGYINAGSDDGTGGNVTGSEMGNYSEVYG